VKLKYQGMKLFPREGTVSYSEIKISGHETVPKGRNSFMQWN
jgi:hypothetical protein